jgi:DNA-binding transcriptional regulator YdaS (Cro superfamily)
MTLAQRILIKAIERTGSTERLARLLGIAPDSLNAYVDGRRAIPEALAHAVADIVLDESR